MGVDLGTSGCRAVAFDVQGRDLAMSVRAYGRVSSHADVAELDADLMWRSARQCIAEVNELVTSDPVSAVAFAVLGEAVVPVDEDGQVLAHMPLAVDMRATSDAAAIGEAIGLERLHDITGQFSHPMLTVAKIHWWQENEPQVCSQAARFLCAGDFAAMRLGLDPAIDYTMAARTGAFDITTRAWSPEILRAGGIAEERLAQPVAVGTPLGLIDPTIASELGFQSEVTLVAGAHDQAASMWGSGVVAPGDASFSLGTSECLAFPVSSPAALGASPFPYYPVTGGNEHILLAGSPVGGALLEWFGGELAKDETVAELLAEAGDGDDAVVVLPYFAGTGMAQKDPAAKGAMAGLSLNTKRSDIVRGILESSGFELAANLELLREVGIDVGEIRVVGGATRSQVALQIRADAAERPLIVPTVDAPTCRGAALVAGCGTGIYSDLAHVPEPAGPVSTIDPRSAGASERAARRVQYRNLYLALRESHQTDERQIDDKGDVHEHHLC